MGGDAEKRQRAALRHVGSLDELACTIPGGWVRHRRWGAEGRQRDGKCCGNYQGVRLGPVRKLAIVRAFVRDHHRQVSRGDKNSLRENTK